jgi:serine/threonine protein kinase
VGIDWSREICVIEYCQHGDVLGFIQRNPQLSLLERMKVFNGCVQAVVKMHEHLISEFGSADAAHCDLKPENFLVSEAEPSDSSGKCAEKCANELDSLVIRITDLGSMTQGNKPARAGTPGWCAPEQGKRDSKGHEAPIPHVSMDVYALGTTGCYILGEWPLKNRPRPSHIKPRPNAAADQASISRSMCWILGDCLEETNTEGARPKRPDLAVLVDTLEREISFLSSQQPPAAGARPLAHTTHTTSRSSSSVLVID